jgi:hypothetical protein
MSWGCFWRYIAPLKADSRELGSNQKDLPTWDRYGKRKNPEDAFCILRTILDLSNV